MSLILLLSPLTQATDGTIVGTASVSLGEATVSADGVGTALGTASIALGTTTVTATGDVTPIAVGTALITLGGASVSSSGTVLPFITGSLSQTLGTATLNAYGFQTAVGDLVASLSPATLNATGFQTAVGDLDVTLNPATVDAAGLQTARGTLTQTLGAATLVGVGVPTPATATLSRVLDPVEFVSSGTLTYSPAAPTFGPILADATAIALKALAAYELITFSSSYVLIKATGVTIPSNVYNPNKSVFDNAQAIDAMVRVIAKTINDTVSTTDSLTTGAAPKIDSVSVSTVGYGLLQDYVSGDYFAEDYVGSSFTF